MLFLNRKKTLIAQGLFSGFSDQHSHILPGVDDGVKTMDEAIAILSSYADLGIKEVKLTPHIQEFMPNTTKNLQDTFRQLQLRLSELPNSQNSEFPNFRTSEFPNFRSSEFPNFRSSEIPTLHLAAEYMLDALFQERLESKDLLYHSLPGEEPHLLVETSYLDHPMGFWDILRDIMSRGIRPILAHPERYQYMTEKDYVRLHEMGVILQLNLPSLLGVYGAHVEKRARYLLEKHYITLFGTDIHDKNLLAILQRKKTTKINL